MTFDESANPDAWLRRAEANLTRTGSPADEYAEIECFHAQQAAEMAVKAVYVAMKIPHPYTHEIRELLDGLQREGVFVPDAVWDADDLTVHAVISRYPGATNATEKDRVKAVRLARAVLNWAREEVKKRSVHLVGFPRPLS